jgi:alpha-1,3-rhamnosyl/mannosyltransferase
VIRLAVNAVALLSPSAGVATYIRQLMTALSETGAVHARYFYGLKWSERLRISAPPALMSSKGLVQRWVPFAWEASRALQAAVFAMEARPHRFDLYHEPTYLLHGERVPAVVTVHDLSFVHYPDAHPHGRVRVLAKRLPRSLEASRAVITDSQAVREELIRAFSLPAAKVHAVPLGVSGSFRPRSVEQVAPAMQRFGLDARSYILSVGTLEPRKNLIRTVRAYSKLPGRLRHAFPLVVVGAVGWHESAILAELEPLVRTREARVLSYVDEESLALLYAGAAGVVYPSLYEGFGLPIAEAMASAVPVLTSRVGCMHELAEGAGVLVDPMDVEDIARGLERLLEDEPARTAWVRAGLERAGALTWARCADRTLAVYREALAR